MSAATKNPTQTPESTPTAAASAPAKPLSEQRKFCSSCSRDKPVEGGVMVKCANGATRWKCASCQAKSKIRQGSKVENK